MFPAIKRLNTITYTEKMFSGTTTLNHSPFFWTAISLRIFVHLSVITALYYFSVYKLIGWGPGNIYLFKIISRNNRKRCRICSKLTINTVENHSGVFIVNFKHVTLFFSVSIVDFEQENICRGPLSCASIITQSLRMSRCFI